MKTRALDSLKSVFNVFWRKPSLDAYVLNPEQKYNDDLIILGSFEMFQDMKFLGVNCETNDAKVVRLSSTIEAHRRSYK